MRKNLLIVILFLIGLPSWSLAGAASNVSKGDTESSFVEGASGNQSDGYFQIFTMTADPSKGFHWDYYLCIPDVGYPDSVLLVEPNNSPTTDDDPKVHAQYAREQIENRSSFSDDIQLPLLVPAFPSPRTDWRLRVQELDRDTLLTDITELKRVDLQLKAMIEDAKSFLAGFDILVDEKVFMMGFGASGMFAERFTVLHPGDVRAAALGAQGGWLAPVASWSGEQLRYNVGIADLENITAAPVDIDRFKTVPIYMFIGDRDNADDPVASAASYDPEDRDLIFRLFGDTKLGRWPKAKEVYDSIGANARFVTYPGAGHEFTGQMQADVMTFFLDQLDSPGGGGGKNGGGCFVTTSD